MIAYLINFTLCSGLLLLVYRVFLAHEKMFRFNRAYLLLGLVFSVIVPFISIKTYRQSIPVVYQQIINQPVTAYIPANGQITPGDIAIPTQLQTEQAAIPRNYLLLILLSIYGAVTLLLLLRFIINLYRISRAVNKGNIIPHGNATLVLTHNNVSPHSFLKYIFVNAHQYNNGLIEPQIICHEQAHATQLHTLDIIFIELLQVFCWFNPAISLYRNAIQLNHEFLADDAVIKTNTDTPAYQFLLLANAGQNSNLQLTSQFNYLTTKKRLIMMTRNTNTKMAIGKQLALAPVLAAAILIFSHKVVAKNTVVTVKPDAPQTVTTNKPSVRLTPDKGNTTAKPDAPQSVLDEYLAIEKKYKAYRPKGHPLVIGAPIIPKADDDRLRSLYLQMSPKQQKEQIIYYTPINISPKKRVTDKDLNTWKDGATYGVWINEKRVKNNDLKQYNPDSLINTNMSALTPVAIKNDGFRYQLELLTEPRYAEYVNRFKTLNKNGGLRMYNFNIVRKSKEKLAQFTTDAKPDYIPDHVKNMK